MERLGGGAVGGELGWRCSGSWVRGVAVVVIGPKLTVSHANRTTLFGKVGLLRLLVLWIQRNLISRFRVNGLVGVVPDGVGEDYG